VFLLVSLPNGEGRAAFQRSKRQHGDALTKGGRHPDILQALREEVVVARILQEQQSAQQLAQQSGQQLA
jgi:hypothetical protein